MANEKPKNVKVNPSVPVLNVKCGDLDLSLKNSPEMAKYLFGMSVVRNTEGFNEATLKLFDETALVLEWALLQGYKQVQFQYGMDISNLSQIFTGQINNYNLEFVGNQVVLELSLIMGTNSSEESVSYDGTPSDIFKQICKEEGWIVGKVVATKPVDGVTFNRTGQTAVDFINQVLIPQSISNDGKSNYQFYTTSTDNGGLVANFTPVAEGDVSQYKVYEIVYGGGNGGSSKDAELVISFSPNYNGLYFNALEGNVSSTSTDSDTSNSNDTVTNAIASGDVVSNDTKIEVPTLDSLTNVILDPYTDKGIVRRIGSSTFDSGEMGRIAEYIWQKLQMASNPAQLVLRGDASFSVMSYVALVVMTPDGFFHHSSGLYQVLEISDDIDMGEYTTTLNMIKVGLTVGSDGSITVNDPSQQIFPQGLGDSSITDTSASNNGVVTSDASEQEIRKILDEKYKGLPYITGGVGPKGYDCSGFTQSFYALYGVSQPRTTAEMLKQDWAEEILPFSWDNVQPGDCIVYNKLKGSGHIVLIVNKDTIFHFSKPGDVGKYQSNSYHKKLYTSSTARHFRPLSKK